MERDQDENAHVALLEETLGSAAVNEPSFNFQVIPENLAKFQQTAFVLENTGVHALRSTPTPYAAKIRHHKKLAGVPDATNVMGEASAAG
jgi:Ferritin-like domain